MGLISRYSSSCFIVIVIEEEVWRKHFINLLFEFLALWEAKLRLLILISNIIYQVLQLITLLIIDVTSCVSHIFDSIIYRNIIQSQFLQSWVIIVQKYGGIISTTSPNSYLATLWFLYFRDTQKIAKRLVLDLLKLCNLQFKVRNHLFIKGFSVV
jgi:hypothetical protein